MLSAALIRVDRFARLALPGFVLACLIVVQALPLGLPDAPPPPLPAALVLTTALRRPAAMPVWLAALGGLLADLLGGGPLGLETLLLVLTQATGQAFAVRHRINTFARAWGLFALVALLQGATGWAVVSLLQSIAVDLRPALFAALFGIALWPVFARFVMQPLLRRVPA